MPIFAHLHAAACNAAPRSALRRAASLATVAPLVLAALLFTPSAHATCPKFCLSPMSIKNAAGVDPKLFTRIEFEADKATLVSSDEVVREIAAAWKASPRKGVLTIATIADDGMRGAPARSLAAARASALSKALVEAGVPAAKLSVKRR